MQDAPDSAELLDSLAAYLFGELRPLVPSEQRFKVLVAANVCAVLARELRAGEDPDRADLELFSYLAGGEPGKSEAEDPAPDAASAARAAAIELAAELREGRHDERIEETIELLGEHVRRKLEIARPGYGD